MPLNETTENRKQLYTLMQLINEATHTTIFTEEKLPQTSEEERKHLHRLTETASKLTSNTDEPADTRLQSIFSKLVVKDVETAPQYHKPRPLQLDETIFPDKVSLLKGSDITKAIVSFKDEVNGLKPRENFTDATYADTLFSIMEKYLWSIPISKADPCVSMFIHIKTAYAIANCLLNSPEDQLTEKTSDEPSMLLISGDLSGVQQFIYSITSKGAAKGLRGRSLYLQLLSEAITHYILDQLQLPKANIIFCGGAMFYILAPANIEEKLKYIRKNVTEKLLRHHDAELYLTLEYTSLKTLDLEKGLFGEKWKELGEQLAEAKKRKFGDSWDNAYATLFEFNREKEHKTCSSCGRQVEKVTADSDNPDLEKCDFCLSVENLAKEFSEAETIWEIHIEGKPNLAKEDHWRHILGEFGVVYVFKDHLKYINHPEVKHIHICTLNDTTLPEDENPEYPVSLGFRFLANTKLWEFKELAKDSPGEKWAVLRMDVDHLGMILGTGLGKDKTVSLVSTLSYMISLYFNGWLRKIVKEFEENCYSIYSGGDDLFLVTSWNKAPEIAVRINEDFRKFTCHHPEITISAGISIALGTKYPIHRAAETAKEALEDGAKEIGGRNSIQFLGEPVKWSDFNNRIVKLKTEISKLLESENQSGLSNAFVQKLYELSKISDGIKNRYGVNQMKYDGRRNRWRWLLDYQFSRVNLKGREVELDRLERSIRSNIEYLGVCTRWVKLESR